MSLSVAVAIAGTALTFAFIVWALGRSLQRPKRQARPGKVRIQSEHGYSIEPFDDYEELRLRIAELTFMSGVAHYATVLEEPVESEEA